MILSQEERKLLWNLVNNKIAEVNRCEACDEAWPIKDLARIRQKLEVEVI